MPKAGLGDRNWPHRAAVLSCGGEGQFSKRGSAPARQNAQTPPGRRSIFVSSLSTLRSTSMFDMRCEEEAAVQPHSRARQEQLQLINNQLREEDDKWQDVSAGQGHG